MACGACAKRAAAAAAAAKAAVKKPNTNTAYAKAIAKGVKKK